MQPIENVKANVSFISSMRDAFTNDVLNLMNHEHSSEVGAILSDFKIIEAIENQATMSFRISLTYHSSKFNGSKTIKVKYYLHKKWDGSLKEKKRRFSLNGYSYRSFEEVMEAINNTLTTYFTAKEARAENTLTPLKKHSKNVFNKYSFFIFTLPREH